MSREHLRYLLDGLICIAMAATGTCAWANSHSGYIKPKHLVALDLSHSEPKDKPETLTLETVVQSALESFPSLIASAKRKDMAAGEKLAAEGGFDTSLKLLSRSSVAGIYENEMVDIGFEQPTPYWGATFFGGYRLGSGNFPVYEGKSQTADSGEFRAGVSIPLWRNRAIDKRRASLAQAELSELIAHHDFDAQLLELQRVASQRYWDWVLAGRRLAAARHLLDIAETRDAGLRERIAGGDLPPIDATDNQRAILERRERVIAAERMLEQASIQLSLYLRTPDGEPQLPQPSNLPDSFPEPRLPARMDLNSVIDEALSRRPELKRMEQQRKNAQIDRDLARNLQQPGVDLTLSGAQDLGINPETKYYQINRTEMYVGVSIDLPVQQRVATGKIASAEANLDRIEADYQLLGDRIKAEVKDALSAIKAARKRLEIAQKHRETAMLVEDGERAKYELGDSTLMFVNQRELASGDAAILVADAFNSFHKSIADYRFALGELQATSTQTKPVIAKLKLHNKKHPKAD